MDYSNHTNDTDALAGSSPWGSSSPRAGRTPYAPKPPSEPDSPEQTPRHQHSGSQDSISANPFASEASATSQALPPPAQEVEREIPADGTAAQPHIQEQRPVQQQAQQPQQTGHLGHSQGRPGATRYHPQRQQRPVPAYKLQAKVTALERTGRKDPVIRFDVYVSSYMDLPAYTDLCRPIFPSSEPLNSETSVAHTLSSSSFQTTSSRQTPKHWCLLFRQH